MTLTCLFAKIQARDPTVFPAWEALRMATIEGAQAVGLGDEVGSLEAGKQTGLLLNVPAGASHWRSITRTEA